MLQHPLDAVLLPGERDWLNRLVSDLDNQDIKLVYADWLEENDDQRCEFLRAFVAARQSMDLAAFDHTNALLAELTEREPGFAPWGELTGHAIVAAAAVHGVPDFAATGLRLARPALRVSLVDPNADELSGSLSLPIGASKIGGLPDLPPNMPWVPGGDCHAIYNDDTGGTSRLAGFLGQLNLAEIAGTYAACPRGAPILPTTGVLSFFCFQDWENDNPDAIGAKAIWFPNTSALVATSPPNELTEGNGLIDVQQMMLEETLDLPENYDGPWSDEMSGGENDVGFRQFCEQFRDANFANILGYGRATSGADPTPDKQSRHLIMLDTSYDCRLHLQIPGDALAVGDFDKLTLAWVDFD